MLALAIAIALPFGFGGGCSSPTETRPPATQFEGVVVNDNVFVVDPDVLTLTDIADTTFTYSYSGPVPAVTTGDILIDPTAGGYLRRVSGVDADGGVLTLETEAAGLADAVYRGAVRDTFPLALAEATGKAGQGGAYNARLNHIAPGVMVTANGLQFADLELFAGTVGTADMVVTMTAGSFELTPQMDLAVEISGGRLWRYEANVLGALEFDAELQVSASDSVTFDTPPLSLYSTTSTFVQAMGPVPVIQEVTLELLAVCSFALETPIDGELELGASSPVEAGGMFSSTYWFASWDATIETTPGQATLAGSPVGTVRCFLLPVFTVDIYSVNGVQLGLRPYLGLTGESDGFWWRYDLQAGLGLDFSGWGSSLDQDVAPAAGSWDDLDLGVAASDSALIGGLIVKTTPPGARIMLDGGSTGRVTPDTLTYFEVGSHEVRAYLPGYNEVIEQVYWTSGFVTTAPVLTVPSWPRAVFTITTPEPGAEFGDNVITVSGLVELDDGGGSRWAFDDDTAVLALNGMDQILDLTAGWFSTEVSIFTGQNDLEFRATGQNGNTGVSDPLTVTGTFQPDDIVITLSWNTPTSDIDLHVWNPHGEHCFYGNQQITEGFLDIDDVEGYGPETFTATSAINGTYTVRVNSYSLDLDAYADATVTVWLNGGVPAHYGPQHFTVADGNGIDPLAWWEVTVFTMGEGQKMLTVEPADPERRALIERDLRNLPPK